MYNSEAIKIARIIVNIDVTFEINLMEWVAVDDDIKTWVLSWQRLLRTIIKIYDNEDNHDKRHI